MARAKKSNQTSELVVHMSRDIMRLMRKERGETLEEIARTEGVSDKVIRKSVENADFYRLLNSEENMNTAVVAMLLGNLVSVDKGFKNLLNAKSYVERQRADGSSELVPVEDSKTQLRAIQVYGKYIESLQKKPGGPGTTVNVNSNNQTANVQIRGGGFAERLSEIRRRVQEHNQLPPVVVDAPDEDEDIEDAEIVEEA